VRKYTYAGRIARGLWGKKRKRQEPVTPAFIRFIIEELT
jgi:hypothetical protein